MRVSGTIGRRYLVFLAAVLIGSIVYCQYTAALPVAIARAGLSLWWYSAVVSLKAVIVAAFEVVTTKFVQTWPLRLTMLAGFVFVAAGYGVYAISIAPVFLIVGTVIWTLSEIIGAPTTFAYPGMIAPARLRGRYIGVMQSLFGLGAAVGPIVGIGLLGLLGPGVWLWAALAALLAAVLGQVGVRRPAAPDDPDATPGPASGAGATG